MCGLVEHAPYAAAGLRGVARYYGGNGVLWDIRSVLGDPLASGPLLYFDHSPQRSLLHGGHSCSECYEYIDRKSCVRGEGSF